MSSSEYVSDTRCFITRFSLGVLASAHAGSQHARSSIMLCASARHRGCTRMPVDILSMLPASTACTIAVSAPSGVIERERERMVERMLRRRLVDPRPRPDRARRADLDELVERVAGVRVVLERRDEHLAVARPDAEDPMLLEPGEERADDGPERARIRELERALDDARLCS